MQTYQADIYYIKTEEEQKKALELAEQHPDNYLLKPNREGGGHNIFGLQMVNKLKTSTVEEMGSYILMQKIIPVPDIGFKIKDGKVTPAFVQSETGCFGYVLSSDKEVLKCKTGGWMTRTKDATALEGGICAGVSMLDYIAFRKEE